MIALLPPLNIACSCDQCTAFLQPLPTRNAPMTHHLASPSCTSSTPTKVKLERLQSSAAKRNGSRDDTEGSKRESKSNSRIISKTFLSFTRKTSPLPPLHINTNTSSIRTSRFPWTASRTNSDSSTSSNVTMSSSSSTSTSALPTKTPASARTPSSSFAKTPGVLCCTHKACTTRIPVTTFGYIPTPTSAFSSASTSASTRGGFDTRTRCNSVSSLMQQSTPTTGTSSTSMTPATPSRRSISVSKSGARAMANPLCDVHASELRRSVGALMECLEKDGKGGRGLKSRKASMGERGKERERDIREWK